MDLANGPVLNTLPSINNTNTNNNNKSNGQISKAIVSIKSETNVLPLKILIIFPFICLSLKCPTFLLSFHFTQHLTGQMVGKWKIETHSFIHFICQFLIEQFLPLSVRPPARPHTRPSVPVSYMKTTFNAPYLQP